MQPMKSHKYRKSRYRYVLRTASHTIGLTVSDWIDQYRRMNLAQFHLCVLYVAATSVYQ